IAPNDYVFYAPRLGETYANDGPGLIFTSDVPSVSVQNLASQRYTQSSDGSSGQRAATRFLIRIGSQWYASEYEHLGKASDGIGGFAAVSSAAAGISFTDGSDWRELTVAVGASGVGALSLAAAPVGGTLSGTVTHFGVLTRPGNNGD